MTAIGESLHLSPKTVSTYRTRLLDKLKLGNNAELTRYVIEHKLGE
ncbi:MAG TPA: LuxR C-terminal-related transcriptional regulator [Rhodocyclaceae bacterium]|nr:LuxR C-terminal-related transcriptional regulator [Rhodocyclaceae bacterium]